MDIRGQDQAYKRGLVLGLTMAEIIILVLFCLLLAFAAVFADHRERIKLKNESIAALEKAGQVDPKDLRLVAILRSYWEKHAPKDVDFRGYFNQLVLQVEELEKFRTRLETLVEKNRDLEEAAQQTKQLEDFLREQGIDVKTPEGRERLKEMAGGPGEHDWPPIIMLSEADRCSFQVGSAELSDCFRRLLIDEVVPKLLELIGKYKVNVVEVVGHTDEQPYPTNPTRPSTLDAVLPKVFKDDLPGRRRSGSRSSPCRARCPSEGGGCAPGRSNDRRDRRARQGSHHSQATPPRSGPSGWWRLPASLQAANDPAYRSNYLAASSPSGRSGGSDTRGRWLRSTPFFKEPRG